MNIMKVGTMCFLFSGKIFFFFSIGRASQCVIHALGNKGVALFKQPFSYIERSFFVLSRAWDKEKNSESPRGIEPQTFGFLRSDAQPLSHRDSLVSEAQYEIYFLFHSVYNPLAVTDLTKD